MLHVCGYFRINVSVANDTKIMLSIHQILSEYSSTDIQYVPDFIYDREIYVALSVRQGLLKHFSWPDCQYSIIVCLLSTYIKQKSASP